MCSKSLGPRGSEHPLQWCERKLGANTPRFRIPVEWNRIRYKGSPSHGTCTAVEASLMALQACMRCHSAYGKAQQTAYFGLYERQCVVRLAPVAVCGYPLTGRLYGLLLCTQHELARVSDSRSRGAKSLCSAVKMAFADSLFCVVRLCMVHSLAFFRAILASSCLHTDRKMEEAAKSSRGGQAETLDPRGWLRAHRNYEEESAPGSSQRPPLAVLS
ncbi:hypothetical protein V8C42DRAFT_156101 [Trichoderma barbatum]